MDFLDLGAFEEMMGNSKHKQGSVRERESPECGEKNIKGIKKFTRISAI